MNRKHRILCCIAALTVSLSTYADPDEPSTSAHSDSEALPGTATQHLLSLQRSGSLGSSNEQYLSGKVRAQTYKRYVDSFGRAIPESYINDSFTNGD